MQFPDIQASRYRKMKSYSFSLPTFVRKEMEQFNQVCVVNSTWFQLPLNLHIKLAKYVQNETKLNIGLL